MKADLNIWGPPNESMPPDLHVYEEYDLLMMISAILVDEGNMTELSKCCLEAINSELIARELAKLPPAPKHWN